jgi:pimeloyl-ACP methyl ester carboxylesterase
MRPRESGLMQNRAVIRDRPLGAVLALVIAGNALTACAGAPPAPSSTGAVPTEEPLGPFPTELVEGLRTDPDVFYTDVVQCGTGPCQPPADVLAPAEGADLPTVVLLNGGGKLFTERRYQAPLAAELAKRGAVVFLIAYRGISTASYDQDSWSDARCAIRYARAHTEEYGGDPSRVVVVGHSQGGLMGLDIAIHPEEEAEGCLDDGSAIPDGVIALGSPPPSLRGVSDSAPPLWLFSGSEDPRADADVEPLRDVGFDAESDVLPGVTHDGITDPAAAPEVVDLIVEALESI